MTDIEDEDDEEYEDGLPYPVAPPNPSGALPVRIEASMRFMYLIQGALDAREVLTKKEEAAYVAALDCMRMYLSGENDHGDLPPRTRKQRLDSIPEPTDEDLRKIEEEDEA